MDKALQLMPIVQWIKVICPNGQLFSDSREIKYETDAVFFAYEGDSADGRNYIARAIESGAKAVVYESSDFEWNPDWKVDHLGFVCI